MTKINRTLEVCSFCYSYHQMYLKGEPFSYGRKEKVTTCTCCGQAMCADCDKNASKELQDSILKQY